MASRPPRVGTYQPQVAPGNSPAFRSADPDSFGAGVGRAIEGFGNAVQNATVAHAEAKRRRKYEDETAATGVAFATVRSNIAETITDRRVNAPPGAEGHTETVLKEYDRQAEELLKGVTDARVRRRLQMQLADYRENIFSSENAFEAAAGVNKRLADIDDQGTVAANRAMTDPKPEALGEELQAIDDTIEAMTAPADAKAKAKKAQQRKIATAWAQGMIEQDPAGLVEILKAGIINPYVEPEDLRTLTDTAQAEIRRLEAAELAKVRLEEAALREEITTFTAKLNAGIEFDDATIADMAAKAEAIGDKSAAFQLGNLGTRNRINRETREWTPAQYDAAIQELLAKEDRSEAEDLTLAHLTALRPTRVAEFNDRPGDWAARNGAPPPAIDFERPETLTARAEWARGVAAATGRPPPILSKEEMAQLRPNLERGPQARLNLVRTLRLFGTREAGEIARQLAPDDELFRVAMSLRDSTAKRALLGVDALKANPKVVDKEAAQEIFNEVAAAVPPHLRGAIQDTAINVYASMMADAGQNEWLEGPFRKAIHLALGAGQAGGGQVGGLATWNGKPVWLPPDMAADEFERRISRADAAAWASAAGGQAPQWADGSPVYTGQLRELELVPADGPGRFYLRSATGGVLTGATGKPWVVDVRKLK